MSLKILGRFGGSTPSSYSKIFDVLKEQSFIDQEIASNIAQAARFRNVIAHRYGEINLQIVSRVLSKHLVDFQKFLKTIERSLQERGIDIFQL